MFGLVIYGLNLDISQKDLDLAYDTIFSIGASAMLINDHYSYDKEVYQCRSSDGLQMNAVAVLMESYQISAPEAKKILLGEKIPALEQEYLENLRLYMSGLGLKKSLHMTAFLGELACMAGGNWFWSSCAYRYNMYQQPPKFPPTPSEADTIKPISIENAGGLADLNPGTNNLETVDTRAVTAPVHHVVHVDATVINRGSTLASPISLDDKVSQFKFQWRNALRNGDTQIVREPSEYLRSLPSKGLRGQMIKALNLWMRIPDSVLLRIETIISYLHESSLL